MRTRLFIAPIAAFFLCSCGGGLYNGPGTNSDGGGSPQIDTTGATTPAVFVEAGDAAKAAAVVARLIVPRGPAFSSAPCATGTSMFTPDTTTAYAGDGRRVYDQCVQNDGSEQIIADGVTTDRCFAATPDNSSCTNLLVQAGESSQPLTLEAKSSSNDVIERFLGLTRKTYNGNSTTDARDGVFEIENLLSHQSMAIAFDHSSPLTISSATNSDGSRSVTASGLLGLNDSARATTNCISGQMTVSTPSTPLSIDSGGNFRAGELRFTSSDNNSYGIVSFQGDGSVSASVNGGTPQVITKSTLDSFCSVQ